MLECSLGKVSTATAAYCIINLLHKLCPVDRGQGPTRWPVWVPFAVHALRQIAEHNKSWGGIQSLRSWWTQRSLAEGEKEAEGNPCATGKFPPKTFETRGWRANDGEIVGFEPVGGTRRAQWSGSKCMAKSNALFSGTWVDNGCCKLGNHVQLTKQGERRSRLETLAD
jgi:hypothetical protein